MALPDFFIIGAPKAGTSALHAALATHHRLYLSPVKEPKFFLCDGAPPSNQQGPGDAHSAREWIWRRERYEALFDDAPAGMLRGESTPFYLYDLAAHRRIATAAPHAKLIAIVRDPIDRAYSNWTHLWSDGLEPIGDFEAACAAEDERVRAGWAPFWHYERLGRYGEQLEHLLTVFPRQQAPPAPLPGPGRRAVRGAGRDLPVPRRRAGGGSHRTVRERASVRGAIGQDPCAGRADPLRRGRRCLRPAAGVAHGVRAVGQGAASSVEGAGPRSPSACAGRWSTRSRTTCAAWRPSPARTSATGWATRAGASTRRGRWAPRRDRRPAQAGAIHSVLRSWAPSGRQAS